MNISQVVISRSYNTAGTAKQVKIMVGRGHDKFGQPTHNIIHTGSCINLGQQAGVEIVKV